MSDSHSGSFSEAWHQPAKGAAEAGPADGHANAGASVTYEFRQVYASGPRRPEVDLFAAIPSNVAPGKAVDIWALPEEEYRQRIMEKEQLLELRLQEIRMAAWLGAIEAQAAASTVSPLRAPHTIIRVCGLVVAWVDNQGIVTMQGELSHDLRRELEEAALALKGPQLAARRAGILAASFSTGTETAPTALTQEAFEEMRASLYHAPQRLHESDLIKDPVYLEIEYIKAMREAYVACL